MRNLGEIRDLTFRCTIRKKQNYILSFGSTHAFKYGPLKGTAVPHAGKLRLELLGSVTTIAVKTVLTRIISIVRVPSLYPNKDNPINRDDDAKRSPLSAKHVDDFAFTASGRWRLMIVPVPPSVGIRRR